MTETGHLRAIISLSVWRMLKGHKAGRSWEQLLGYNVHQLKRHLETQFESGMSWINYGHNGWTLDHIIPVKQFAERFTDPAVIKQCFALSNLMPRWHTTEIAQAHGSMQLGNTNKGCKLLDGITV